MVLVSVHMTQSYTCSTHLGVYFHGHNLQSGEGRGGGTDGEMTGRVCLLDNPRLNKAHTCQIQPSAKPCRKIQNGVPINYIQIRSSPGRHYLDCDNAR